MNRKTYSVEKEIEYYQDSPSDLSTVPYDHLTKYFLGSIGEDFFRGKSVLDIGSGEGTYSAWIADHGHAKEVTGLELTEHRIRRDFEKKLSNLHFVAGNIFDLDKTMLKQSQFDIVFMNLVLHHLRHNLLDTAKIIRSLLHPGGKFAAFEPNVFNPAALLLHIYHERSANEGFLSPYRIKEVFHSVGFNDISIGFFWRNRQWAKNPLLASSFWITAIAV